MNFGKFIFRQICVAKCRIQLKFRAKEPRGPETFQILEQIQKSIKNALKSCLGRVPGNPWRGPGRPLEAPGGQYHTRVEGLPFLDGGDLFFGGLLGPSWGRLGASWGRLGPLGGLWSLSWARLGTCLGLSWPGWACLVLSWPVLTCLGLIFV